jgi:subtilisin family serine protease
MKFDKKYSILFLTLSLFYFMNGCGEDDFSDFLFENEPSSEIELIETEVSCEASSYNSSSYQNLTFSGTDTDKDGLSDEDENLTSTDFNNTDSDNDKISDLIEILSGTDPNQANSDFLPNDPLFKYQWYLKNDGSIEDSVSGFDINVTSVWAKYAGTQNIKVSVIDSGIECDHPDLNPNLDMNNSIRFSDRSNNPSPTAEQLYSDTAGSAHGTSCAGIIGARGWNNKGVTGVAPFTSLVGFNAFSDPTDANFQEALAKTTVDVSSNSWGGSGTTLYDDPLSLDGVETGIENGRNGKGIIYVFASGNENSNANYSTLHGSRYLINVSALESNGEKASYSNYGANVWISAFGGSEYGGDNNFNIVTTDLTGMKEGLDSNYYYHFDAPNNANSNGDYTTNMNGTSSATPIVAGASALILQANPNLTYRDLKYILATTARKVHLNEDNEDMGIPYWVENARGITHSPIYGFGILDVASAVAKAETFENLSEEIILDKKTQSVEQNINSGALSDSVSSTINISEDILVEHVTINLNMPNFTKVALNKLEVILTSASGTESYILYPNLQNTFVGTLNNWEFSTVAFLDETSKGSWVISVRDTRSGISYSTEFVSWSIQIFGRASN